LDERREIPARALQTSLPALSIGGFLGAYFHTSTRVRARNGVLHFETEMSAHKLEFVSMTTVVRCPRTGRACSEGTCRERHWCRKIKGGLEKHTAAEKRDYIRHSRPHGLSVAEGCRLMGLPRSTFYDAPSLKADDAEIIANMITICDEFEKNWLLDCVL